MNDKERKEIGDKAYSKANRIGTKGCDLTIKDFSLDELKTFLITCDGMGPKFKIAALEELIKKVEEGAENELKSRYEDMGVDVEFSQRD